MTKDKRWKVILLLSLHVLLGVLIGTFVTLHFTKKKSLKSSDPHKYAEKLLKEATTALKLTPAQISEIEPLIQEAARNAREIQKEHLIKMSTMTTAAEDKILEHLTPEQRKLLLNYREKRDKKIKEWMKPGENKL
jgi:hypothetical protein